MARQGRKKRRSNTLDLRSLGIALLIGIIIAVLFVYLKGPATDIKGFALNAGVQCGLLDDGRTVVEGIVFRLNDLRRGYQRDYADLGCDPADAAREQACVLLEKGTLALNGASNRLVKIRQGYIEDMALISSCTPSHPTVCVGGIQCDAGWTCQPDGICAQCGNGAIEGTEACDDGNTDDTDACTNQCIAAVCGDGFVQTGVEQCDTNDAATTTQLCTAAGGYSGVQSCNSQTCTYDAQCSSTQSCGDGTVNGYEQCDDGNTEEKDGCSAVCIIETDLIAMHEEPLPLTRTVGIGTNTWLVFGSDTLPDFDDTTKPFAAHIIGELKEVPDGAAAQTQKSIETWVAWLYKDSTVTDAFGIMNNPPGIYLYINGNQIVDEQNRIPSISFQQGWNMVVVVVDTRIVTSWGFGSAAQPTDPLQEIQLSSKVPLFTHLNFDYDNDAWLDYKKDSSAYRFDYSDRTGVLPPLENQEILSCIILEIEALKYNLQNCKLSSEI